VTGVSPERLPELTISTCEQPGHVGHAARITIGDDTSVTTFCLRPEHAVFLSQALGNVLDPRLAAAMRVIDAYEELARGLVAPNAKTRARIRYDAGLDA
jgi:hypothetical protein